MAKSKRKQTTNSIRENATLIGEDALELGAKLANARTTLDMSRAEIAKKLNLTEDVIAALEDGDFGNLSHKRSVYIEGYYTSYARLLNVSVENTAFGAYDFSNQPEGDFYNRHVRAKLIQADEKHLSDYIDALITGLVLVLILVVGGVIWWVWPTGGEEPVLEQGEVVGVDTTVQELVVGVEVEDRLPFYLQDESSNQLFTQGEQVSEDRVDEPEDSDLEVEVSEVSDDTSTEQSPLQGSVETQIMDEPQTPVDIDTEEPPEPAQIESAELEVGEIGLNRPSVSTGSTALPGDTGELLLNFTGLCWVEVKDSLGAILFRDLGKEGDSAMVSGITPFTIRVGDTSNVVISFNNEQVDMAPFTQDRVANLTVPHR